MSNLSDWPNFTLQKKYLKCVFDEKIKEIEILDFLETKKYHK